jgi:hypothetical protein
MGGTSTDYDGLPPRLVTDFAPDSVKCGRTSGRDGTQHDDHEHPDQQHDEATDSEQVAA